MQLQAALCHPVLAGFLAELGTLAKKDPKAEPKTDFQKWCRSIKPTARRVAHHPKSRAGFVPRATRRRGVVGVVPLWRDVWRATGGYPDLVTALGERVRAEAAKRAQAHDQSKPGSAS